MKSEYAIVIIGYNRLYSIVRLCNSLENANYENEKIDLIFSLDYCENLSVKNFAECFNWKNGNKEVVFHSQKMGLKNHILSCGKFLEKYSAIAILEDDIYVSPCFYSYMKQAIPFYKNCDDIAGISMYSPQVNGYNGLKFVPAQSKSDTYFIQMSQSWGQIWLRKQWNEFYTWYLANKDVINYELPNIPQTIKHWGNNSWVKFYTTYCIVNNKFFVYPYMSMTTCFGDAGVHTKSSDLTGQVNLFAGNNYQFNFANYDNNAVRYDGYLERIGLNTNLYNKKEKIRLCVNLYGDKYDFQNYTHIVTTSQYKKTSPIHTYALQLSPHELNVEQNLTGDGIYLYDLRDIQGKKKINRKWHLLEYHASPKITSDWNMMWIYIRKLIKKYLRLERK